MKKPRPQPGLNHEETANLLGASVVLLAVDRIGRAILLAIDLTMLGWGQMAAVGRAIGFHFMIDRGFTAFQVRSFAGRQLAALHALRDAVLLVFRPLAHFALRVGVLYRR